jgi:hypothetical protein
MPALTNLTLAVADTATSCIKYSTLERQNRTNIFHAVGYTLLICGILFILFCGFIGGCIYTYLRRKALWGVDRCLKWEGFDEKTRGRVLRLLRCHILAIKPDGIPTMFCSDCGGKPIDIVPISPDGRTVQIVGLNMMGNCEKCEAVAVSVVSNFSRK